MKTIYAVLVLLLLFAEPLQAQETERNIGAPLRLTIAGVMISQQIDAGITTYLLAKCGDDYAEANVIVRPIANHPAMLAAVKGAMGVALSYAIYHAGKSEKAWVRKLALITGLTMTGVNSWVAHRNYGFYRNTLGGCEAR